MSVTQLREREHTQGTVWHWAAAIHMICAMFVYIYIYIYICAYFEDSVPQLRLSMQLHSPSFEHATAPTGSISHTG